MAKALMIFNGRSFPDLIGSRSIGWATQSKGSLISIFLLTKENTMDEAQNAGPHPAAVKNFKTGNTDIIESYISLLKDASVKVHIDLDTVASQPKRTRYNEILNKVCYNIYSPG